MNWALSFTVLLLSALPGWQVQAGTGVLSGKVVDAKSRKALGYADIKVLGTRLSTVAKADGTFEIRGVPPGHYRVNAKFVGYCLDAVDADVVAASRVDLVLPIRIYEERIGAQVSSRSRYDAAADSVSLSVRVDSTVIVGQAIQVDLTITNGSSLELDFPADLRPFLQLIYRYPNGDMDHVPCQILASFVPEEYTVVIPSGGQYKQTLVMGGYNSPGTYELDVILLPFGHLWTDMGRRDYTSRVRLVVLP